MQILDAKQVDGHWIYRRAMSSLAPVPIAGVSRAPGTAGMSGAFEICLRKARASIARYLALYNARRPHSSLDGRAPDETYFAERAMVIAA